MGIRGLLFIATQGFTHFQVTLGHVDYFLHYLKAEHSSPKCRFYLFSEKRDVHKISARNSGAGNGCANFMGAWHFLVLSAEEPPCP